MASVDGDAADGLVTFEGTTDPCVKHGDVFDEVHVRACACGATIRLQGRDVLRIDDGQITLWLSNSESRRALATRTARSTLTLQDDETVAVEGRGAVLRLGKYDVEEGHGIVRRLLCCECRQQMDGSFYARYFETATRCIDEHLLRIKIDKSSLRVGYSATGPGILQTADRPEPLREFEHGTENSLRTMRLRFDHACDGGKESWPCADARRAVALVNTVYAMRSRYSAKELPEELITTFTAHGSGRNLAIDSWCRCARVYICREFVRAASYDDGVKTFALEELGNDTSVTTAGNYRHVLMTICQVLGAEKNKDGLKFLDDKLRDDSTLRARVHKAVGELLRKADEKENAYTTVEEVARLLGKPGTTVDDEKAKFDLATPWQRVRMQLLQVLTQPADPAPSDIDLDDVERWPVDVTVGDSIWTDDAIAVLCIRGRFGQAHDVFERHKKAVKGHRRYWERHRPLLADPGTAAVECDAHTDRKSGGWLPVAQVRAFLLSDDAKQASEDMPVTVVTGGGKGHLDEAVTMFFEEIRSPGFTFTRDARTSSYTITGTHVLTAELVDKAFGKWALAWRCHTPRPATPPFSSSPPALKPGRSNARSWRASGKQRSAKRPWRKDS